MSQKTPPIFGTFNFSFYLCTNKRKLMQVDTMNESQMMILESFAGAKDEEELNAGYVW